MALLASGPSAAQTFTLTPPTYHPSGSGASVLGGGGFKPPGTILYEDQYVHVYIWATQLLQSSSEHIAISTFAGVQPFNASGLFNTPSSPGGGIGIALGRIDGSPCLPDSADSQVEFALERFAWGDPFASSLLDCASFSKSILGTVSQLQVSIYTSCSGTCSSYAELIDPATWTVLATVGASGISLANPGTNRRAWYAVTNFENTSTVHSATFSVNTDSYSYER